MTDHQLNQSVDVFMDFPHVYTADLLGVELRCVEKAARRHVISWREWSMRQRKRERPSMGNREINRILRQLEARITDRDRIDPVVVDLLSRRSYKLLHDAGASNQALRIVDRYCLTRLFYAWDIVLDSHEPKSRHADHVADGYQEILCILAVLGLLLPPTTSTYNHLALANIATLRMDSRLPS